MTNQKLDMFKNNLIEYVTFCYNRNNGYKAESLVNNFLFDNITELRDLQLCDDEKETFMEYVSKDPAVESFVKNSLDCFITKFAQSRTEETQTYTDTPEPDASVASIFVGLKYHANNDTDYKNMPSALALAKFNTK